MYRPELDLREATVLIVDDTPTNLAVLGDILREDGYQIFAAPRGDVALRIAERSLPDLILLDVMMPEMDGFETCRRLKSQEATREIPVIFVTARTEVKDVVQGFQLGAVDYICKPLQREEVRARVRTQLKMQALYRLQREQAEYFRAIVNTMAEVLLIVDTEGVIQFVNPAGENLFQHAAADLRGQMLDRVLAAPYDEEYARYFRAEPRISPVGLGPREVVGRSRHGQSFPIELTVTELFLDKALFVCFIQDITQRKRTEDHLVQVAQMDPLTNIANRRCFDDRLAKEWEQAKRSGLPLSLAIIDVDHFKPFNDHFGHLTGDHCLQAVARVIGSAARRAGDLAARYGGEEFALVLPDTESEQAQSIAERLRRGVEALGIQHPMSQSGVVTVSLGICTCEGGASGEPRDLIQAADQGLYRAKAAGRNCVMVEPYRPGLSMPADR